MIERQNQGLLNAGAVDFKEDLESLIERGNLEWTDVYRKAVNLARAQLADTELRNLQAAAGTRKGKRRPLITCQDSGIPKQAGPQTLKEGRQGMVSYCGGKETPIDAANG